MECRYWNAKLVAQSARHEVTIADCSSYCPRGELSEAGDVINRVEHRSIHVLRKLELGHALMIPDPMQESKK